MSEHAHDNPGHGGEIKYRLLTTLTSPARPLEIRATADGRPVCSFEETDTTLEEAHIILSAVRRYFTR